MAEATQSAMAAGHVVIFFAAGRGGIFRDRLFDHFLGAQGEKILTHDPIGITGVVMAILQVNLKLIFLRPLPPPIAPVKIKPALSVSIMPPEMPGLKKDPTEVPAGLPAIPMVARAVPEMTVIHALQGMPIISSRFIFGFVEVGNLRKQC